MKRYLIIVLTVLLIITLCGCASKNDNLNDKKIIAVSISLQATFLEKICGDNFEIVTMIPTGASPETYEPTPKEMTKLSEAQIYFGIGVPAEENIFKNITNSTKLIRLEKAVNEIYHDLEINGGRDPHIWLSIKRAIVMITEMEKELSQLDNNNQEVYKSNSEKYINELKKLEKEITQKFSTCKGKKFITFHPSFAYFADDYGLEMYSLEQDGKEADAKQLANMIDFAKKENIKAIFYQAEHSSKQATAFAEEINGQAIMLEPLSPDYINNLKVMSDSILKAMKQ